MVGSSSESGYTDPNPMTKLSNGECIVVSHRSLLAGYPQITVPSGQWEITDTQQWTSGFLASYFWQMSTLARRQDPSALQCRV